MIPDFGENYTFQWNDLGDIEFGRPNLGHNVPVVIYRLSQYTMREVLAQRYGDESAAAILRDAGWISGREFCLNLLKREQSFSAFMSEVQTKLKELGIGVLRVEKANLDQLLFTLTVSVVSQFEIAGS